MGDRYLPQIFRMTPRDNSLFEAAEHPSDEITVKIQFLKSVSLVLKDLNRKLTTDDMKVSRDDTNKNAIVVRGVRPYDSYGEQDILKVAQNFDRGARIIR